VIAFYPRDFTSDCTAEMRTFAEQYDSLFGPEVVVLGISTDSVETHVRFASSLNLPFRLLSDPEQKVAAKFGSQGRDGYARRTVYVVGPKGDVTYRNLRFNALDPKHYEELAGAVRAARRG
jgi:peroxiredoxin Q/BCP